MIKQRDIQALQSIRIEVDELTKQEKALRARILRQHNASEETEPGSLQIKVSSHTSRQYTANALRAALDPEEFHELEERVSPTQYDKVKVIKSKSNPKPSSHKPLLDEDDSVDWDEDEPANNDEAFPVFRWHADRVDVNDEP